ncbi:hypothetical protein KM043_006154 [Ampulex compressa]|nr:hypothetical protein KM043_006154 [Ampulex compressa]
MSRDEGRAASTAAREADTVGRLRRSFASRSRRRNTRETSTRPLENGDASRSKGSLGLRAGHPSSAGVSLSVPTRASARSDFAVKNARHWRWRRARAAILVRRDRRSSAAKDAHEWPAGIAMANEGDPSFRGRDSLFRGARLPRVARVGGGSETSPTRSGRPLKPQQVLERRDGCRREYTDLATFPPKQSSPFSRRRRFSSLDSSAKERTRGWAGAWKTVGARESLPIRRSAGGKAKARLGTGPNRRLARENSASAPRSLQLGTELPAISERRATGRGQSSTLAPPDAPSKAELCRRSCADYRERFRSESGRVRRNVGWEEDREAREIPRSRGPCGEFLARRRYFSLRSLESNAPLALSEGSIGRVRRDLPSFRPTFRLTRSRSFGRLAEILSIGFG